jgi:hypothetical protein
MKQSSQVHRTQCFMYCLCNINKNGVLWTCQLCYVLNYTVYSYAILETGGTEKVL